MLDGCHLLLTGFASVVGKGSKVRIVSRLIKLDIELTEIYPENDKLALKGKSGALESVVFVELCDMVKLVRLVTNRRNLVFLLKSAPKMFRLLVSDFRSKKAVRSPR